MICKSHAFMLAFAFFGLAPDAWTTLADPAVATAAVHHGAQLLDAAHRDYRCGLGPVLAYAFGLGVAGVSLSVLCIATAIRRTVRLRRTPPGAVSPVVATNVLSLVVRVHYIAGVLGYGAMVAAYALGSFGSSIALGVLSTVVASRGGDAYRAMKWIVKGASVERRAEALFVTSGTDKHMILAATWVFRAAERTVLPAAIAARR